MISPDADPQTVAQGDRGAGDAMNDQLDVLREIVERLDRAGIACMVSGSTALNYYAEPRMTRDIDIVIELGPH